MKSKMDELEARKLKLERDLEGTDDSAPLLLHPGLAELYREQLETLSNALNAPETRVEAAEIIRGLLSSIALIPDGQRLAIELSGELAVLLALGANKNARSDKATGCSVTMVAGDRYRRCRTQLKCKV